MTKPSKKGDPPPLDRIDVPLELAGFEVTSSAVVDGVVEVEVRSSRRPACHHCGSVTVTGFLVAPSAFPPTAHCACMDAHSPAVKVDLLNDRRRFCAGIGLCGWCDGINAKREGVPRLRPVLRGATSAAKNPTPWFGCATKAGPDIG